MTKRQISAKQQPGNVLTRPTENVKRLADHAEAIRSLRTETIQNIILIGDLLLAAKKLASHGNWLAWLKTEFDWSESTARNYMRVAQAGKSATVADLKLPIRSLYQLIAPSTPETVRDAVAKKAKTTKVTHKEVAETITSEQMKAATGIRYEATPPPTSAQIKASQRMVQYEDRPIPTPSPPKASKPKPVSEPKPDPDAKPDFRYFADWIEGEAKHIFAADEWKGIVKHKPQMPAVYRNRVIDCLKSLADQVNDKIAEFEEVPTKH